MKVGTRIEVSATIAPTRKCMLPMPSGYHPVKFASDGAVLLVHESGFRVVDNRLRVRK